MTHFLRKPAWTPPPVVTANAWPLSPSPSLQAWFVTVHRERMAGLPFLNPRLAVEVVGMQRVSGDWLGVLITPWSVQLVLLPGGGTLWSDLAAGCRRTVALPVGDLCFIADTGEADVQAYQYCPLTTSVESFDGMEAARTFAFDALSAALCPPVIVDAEAAEPATDVNLSRRGLLGLRARSGAA